MLHHDVTVPRYLHCRLCLAKPLYIKTNIVIVWECEKPLKWSRGYTIIGIPNLIKMAIDILLIPAMSAKPDCLFTNARIAITDHRNCLGVDTIEALECLKLWFGI
jgi:hAT family protein